MESRGGVRNEFTIGNIGMGLLGVAVPLMALGVTIGIATMVRKRNKVR
jgi:hypothetical protein